MKSKITTSVHRQGGSGHQHKKSNYLRLIKKQLLIMAFLFFTLTLFTSCEVIGDIFKAGMGFGIFLVIAGIALVIFILSKLTGKK